MSRIAALALTCALSTGLTALPALAASEAAVSPASTSVVLTAQGEVIAAPDMAILSFGVVTESDTADEAMRLNRNQMNASLDALKKLGVTDKNIMTSGINLNPRYANNSGLSSGSGLSTIKGYQASNQVTVRIDDLTKVGQSVDAVVKSGVNQVRGVRFGLKDSVKIEDNARKMAIQALSARAELYAQSLGMKIKSLRTLTEGTTLPQYGDVVVAGLNYKATTTPVSEGELKIAITVTGQFELTK